MTVSDDERLARALLTRLAEPGDSLMGFLLSVRSATEVVTMIRERLPPPPPTSSEAFLLGSPPTREGGSSAKPPGPEGVLPSASPHDLAGSATPLAGGAGVDMADSATGPAEGAPGLATRSAMQAEVTRTASEFRTDGPTSASPQSSQSERWPTSDVPGEDPAADLEIQGERADPAGEQWGRRMADRIAAWRRRLPGTDAETDLTVCERFGGRLVCPGDPEWPTQLGDLGVRAPIALWLRGASDLRFNCLRSVAVVGARAATDYGRRIASDLAAELADRRWTVVSGGALGIDAEAHRGALAADGTTMAVLANGVDVAYPPRNEGLLAEIAQLGLVISELPPNAHPTRGRFLIRNRVIAALTLGTVVVEADLRSGSLNTAHYAETLNRQVLAMPGPVTSLMSRGTHKWIRDGRATCVTNALEVIESLGAMGDDLAPEPRGPILPRDHLDPESCRILDAVPARSTAGPSQIAVAAGVDITTAQNRLSLLAAAGFIERHRQGWRIARQPPPPTHLPPKPSKQPN